MIQVLAAASLNGNTAASAKELRDLLDIKSDDHPTKIEIINYADDCPFCKRREAEENTNT